jgi:hypothetical protein
MVLFRLELHHGLRLHKAAADLFKEDHGTAVGGPPRPLLLPRPKMDPLMVTRASRQLRME